MHVFPDTSIVYTEVLKVQFHKIAHCLCLLIQLHTLIRVCKIRYFQLLMVKYCLPSRPTDYLTTQRRGQLEKPKILFILSLSKSIVLPFQGISTFRRSITLKNIDFSKMFL